MIKKSGSFAVLSQTGSLNTNNIDESIKKSLSLLTAPEFFSLAPIHCIASQEQIVHAANSTLEAFSHGTAFSSKPGIEFLVRLTAQHKINEALRLAEIPESGRADALLVLAARDKAKGEKAFSELKKILEFKEEKGLIEKNAGVNAAEIKKLFGISPTELKAMNDLPESEALKLLVLERQALLGL